MKHIEKPCVECLRNNKGIVVFRILIVFLTLLVVGFSIYGILRNVGQKQQVFHRKALAVSEYGLMKALQKVDTGIFEFSDIPKTECEDGWYSVSFKKFEKNDTVFLRIVSIGQVGPSSEKRECTLRLVDFNKRPEWEQHQMY